MSITYEQVSSIWYNLACAYSEDSNQQSNHRFSFPHEETLDPWLPIEHPSKTDQTVHLGRLIRVFDGHTCQLVPSAGHLLI